MFYNLHIARDWFMGIKKTCRAEWDEETKEIWIYPMYDKEWKVVNYDHEGLDIIWTLVHETCHGVVNNILKSDGIFSMEYKHELVVRILDCREFRQEIVISNLLSG